MPNVCKITIAGHIGNVKDLQYTDNGHAMAKFSVAVNHRDDSTTWFNVTAWRRYAEIIHPLLRKGAVVTVIGELHPRSYIVDMDGITVDRISMDINADDIVIAGKGDGTSVDPASGNVTEPASTRQAAT